MATERRLFALEEEGPVSTATSRFFEPVVLLSIGLTFVGAAYLPLTPLQAQFLGVVLIAIALFWSFRMQSKRTAPRRWRRYLSSLIRSVRPFARNTELEPAGRSLRLMKNRAFLPVDDDDVVIDLRDAPRPELRIVR